MKTKAVRLYGKNDLRLEEFDLPEITDDEILAEVMTDSVCMSTYKAQFLGTEHARVPKDVAENPVIVGHEMCGRIVRVGKNLEGAFVPGKKFVIQPALPDAALHTIGYSYRFCGGDATYVVIPKLYIDQGCVLPYDREDYFSGSLAEPMSCIIGGYKVNYHNDFATHAHKMGIVEGGNCAIMAGVGPMGLGAIDYALHGPRKPGLLVVTDINKARLARAESIFSPEYALKEGVRLVYLDTSEGDTVGRMMSLSGGAGYDDVFVYAPVKALIEQADEVLAKDGCLNFFAGPTDNKLTANFNFYDVHYKYTHVAGNTGVLVEINCESDFVSKGEKFHGIVDTVAKVIAEHKPADVEALNACPAEGGTVKDFITSQTAVIGEKISIRRFEIYQTEGKIETYIHMGGKVGVMVDAVDCAAGCEETLHDVALQIAASRPSYITKEEVPASVIEKEKEIMLVQMQNDEKNAKKPKEILEKIVMGKLGKFYSENCLMLQAFVKDDSKTVAEVVGKQFKVNKFVRYEMGEGLEKKSEDLSEEVAKQVAAMKKN